ncbi:protein C3orf33 homolog isoform X1 [Gasterosteus aculeatus]|uniref:Chromosome 3 open reading frame 33 n=1 Tax=Gasterosteus aculeatus aculeatus TaxID=481459 RepID=G3P7Z9_GASAC|nr:protein C3orf33 homolog isoform X1 [Gasterosteus aculeatus aculeatus]
MPESSGETETEKKLTGRQQRDQGPPSSHEIVSLVSQFADDHLALVRFLPSYSSMRNAVNALTRSCQASPVVPGGVFDAPNISTGLAVAGVIVIARSIKLVTKFRAVSEIPARFIESNISLRGKVHSITERGLEVEHVPIYLPIVSTLLSKHKGGATSPMLVHLAGVELTPEGKVWLHKNLAPSQTVWLKLISREDDMLHCLVSQSGLGSMWSYCMNEEVLRLGLARTAPLVGVLPDSRLYWRLLKRLHRAEVKAEKKGRGLWQRDSLWERASKVVRANALFRLMRRMFGKNSE